jgi:hypothetical protein
MRTNYETPHYAILSRFLLLPPVFGPSSYHQHPAINYPQSYLP